MMPGRTRAVRPGGGTPPVTVGDPPITNDPIPTTTPPASGNPPDNTNTWPTAPARRTVRTLRDVQTGESAAGMARDILFGQTTQGMKLLYANAFSSGNYLYLVGAIGEGPVQRITPRVDDKPMTPQIGANTTNPRGVLYTANNGYIAAWVYDGSQTGYQETFSLLSSLDPAWKTNTAAYDNLAFAVVKLIYEPTANSSIPKITFDVEGYRDILDPRPTPPTRGYHENPALIIREVMTNTRWGMKIPAANIDDAAFKEAADDCAVSIFPATPAAAVTAVETTAGSPANQLANSFKWRVTFVSSSGIETAPSPAMALPVNVGLLGNGPRNAQLTIPTGDSLTVSRKIYRALYTDVWTTYRLVGTVANNTATTYIDNMLDGTWAAQAIMPGAAPLSAKRFAIGIGLSRQSAASDWLETLRTHCLGVYTVEEGKYQLRIEKAVAAGYVRQKFSEYHNWGGNKENPNVRPGSIRWGRKKRTELFNEVEVRFTDRQNNWAQGSIVKSRQAVIDGTELARRATYNLPGIFDSSVAGRLATNLLNLAWDDAWFEWEADRSALKTMPWDVVSLTGAGLVNQDVRVRSISSNGNGFTIRGTEYNPNSYSDVLAQADAPLVGGTIGVIVAADLNPPTGLNADEQVDEPQPGIFLPKLIVTFTPNMNPSYGGTRVSVQVGSDPERVVGTFYYSPVVVPIPEGPGKLVTVKAITVHKSGQSGTTPATTTHTMYDPAFPEPVGWVTSGTSGVYWEKPPVRSTTQYGAAAFTASGTTLFTAAAMNNGDLTTAALQFNSTATGWVKVDAGAAVAIREIEIYSLDAAADTPSLTLEASADNVTWFSSSGTDLRTTTLAGKTVIQIAPTTPPLRYWRLSKYSTLAYTGRFSEIRFRTYNGVYPYVKGYRLSGYIPGGGGTRYSKDITYTPTDTSNPVDSGEFRYSYTNFDSHGQLTGGGSKTELNIATISPTNALADARMYQAFSVFAAGSVPGPQQWLPLGRTDYSPATGGNPDINVFADQMKNAVQLTGTNTNWTLSGFTDGYAGRIITVINNTTSEGSLLHEDAGSTAANRLSLPDSVAAALPAGGSISLVYDDVKARWRRLDRASAAVDRIRQITTGYGSINVKGSTNGFSGLHFSDASRIFMVSPQYQGIYNPSGVWQWYFNNGVLELGTVPGSLVSSPRASWVNNAPVTAQELGWKYYGNSHTVVDNSGATYRPSNTDPDVEWSATYPALMGFNGTNTYGVRVDRARYADHLKPGATVTTPTTGDNSTKVATTAFVLANGGSGMERVSSLNPNGNAAYGNLSSANRANGFITNRGYGSGTTNVTIVNVTGKGALRFLSVGPYANGTTGYVTLVIDGTNVLTDAPAYWNSYGDPGYSNCYIGSIVSSYDGTNAQWDLSAVPSDYGITFKTSMVIYVRGSGVGMYTYTNYSYVLY
jgi:hypothetical protein